jgi:Glu-tRNA(Gln) amidotransferase subunit E-like FAD-binding protein
MSNASKYFPWGLSTVLAIILAAVWVNSNQTIAQKDAEIATLQKQNIDLVNESNTKLGKLKDEANEKLKQLAEDATAKVQQLANEANNKLQAANQPEVEVSVSFRKAMISSGKVATIKNASGQSIAISVNIERGSSGGGRTYELTLDPGQAKEIGEREGWAFIPGDRIAISQAGHKSMTYQAQ